MRGRRCQPRACRQARPPLRLPSSHRLSCSRNLAIVTTGFDHESSDKEALVNIVRGIAVFTCLLALPPTPVAAQPAPAPAPVRVIAFDGGWNLPVWAAQRQGAFEANGVSVQMSYTPSSAFLVTSLFNGRNDIALALVDNLIAYQEGQGEAKIPENPDLAVFMGGDGGFLSIVAQPSIKSFADLRGKTLSVDAMTTGAAFVLRDLVARNGLTDADVH